MRLKDLLFAKGYAVRTIESSATIEDAVDRLVQHNVGALVVVETEGSKRLVGIITERDVMRILAARRGALDQLRVEDFMTRRVITGNAEDQIGHAMGVLTKNRIRHLPIVDSDGELVGIISIGDLVKAQYDAMVMENHYLKSYLQG